MKRVKLVLDILMLAAALTLFSKSFFGMAYHEIAGLVLVGLCLVHIALNLKTAVAMARKFLRVPAAMKVGLVVDILLLLCYGFLGLSGVMISKTILTGISAQSPLFRLGHTFAAAVSVVLLGIHIGLHICRRPMKTAVAVALTVAVLCGGVWGVVSSNQLRWLSAPFTAGQLGGQSSQGGGFGNGQHMGQGKGQGNGQHMGQGNGQGNGQGKGQLGLIDRPEPSGDEEDRQAPTRPEGMGAGQHMGQGMASASPAQKLSTVVMFGGMILSCSMLTYWAVVLTKKREKRSPAPSQEQA